jgi:RNA polymerase sigma factor for flagellar operon FliA
MLEAVLCANSDGAVQDYGRALLERAYRDCEMRQGRPATNLEVCDELGLSLRELYALLDLHRGIGLGCVSDLDPAGVEDEGDVRIRYVPDPDQAESSNVYSKSEFRVAMVHAIEALPKNEKLVVSLYHNEDLTMKEIARIFGISESRVAQIHTTAMLRIRGKLQILEAFEQ